MRVRYQLAFTLGEIDAPRRFTALAAIARRDGADKWMRLAVLSSLSSGAGEVFSILAADKDWRTSRRGSRVVWRTWPTYIGRQNHPAELTRLLATLDGLSDDEHALAAGVVRGLSEGLAVGSDALRARLAALDGGKAQKVLDDMLVAARARAGNDQEKPAARAEAIRLLSLDSFADAGLVLLPLIASQQPAGRAIGRVEHAGQVCRRHRLHGQLSTPGRA